MCIRLASVANVIFGLIKAKGGERWNMRFLERTVPPVQRRGMWRVKGLVMGNEDDAPVFFISPNGFFKRQENAWMSFQRALRCQCLIYFVRQIVRCLHVESKYLDMGEVQ